MPVINDLKNKKFGKLLVLEKTNERKWGQIYWLCLCDCGKTRNVLSARLTTGLTKSCGCWIESKVKKTRYNRELALWKKLYNRLKYTAKNRQLKVNIDLEDFKKICTNKCHYCGKDFNSELKDISQDGKIISDTSIKYNGIDRIDSSLGYIRNNIVTCCKACNQAKSDMSTDEFKEFIKRIYTVYINKTEQKL